MRILHLTSNDGRAGGARAVERLHRFLLDAGQESHVLHAGPAFGYTGEVAAVRGASGRVADKAWRMVSSGVGGPSLWRPSWRTQGEAVERLDPDVVHVHWTYGASGIPLGWLSRLSHRTPVVWTMHDMWPMTGGCTNPQGCERWLTGCGRCPQIAGDAGMERTMDFCVDATAWLWRRKRRTLAEGRFRVIVPSMWMRERVLTSGLVADEDVTLVRNVVDTSVFSPGDHAAAREALGIASEALVVLFVGKPGDATAYAGRHPVMVEALSRLRAGLPQEMVERLTLLVVGGHGEGLASQLDGVQMMLAGRVDAEEEMARCFAASDVFLNTTQYDNLPAIVQESLACGVPVVASDVGGVPEIVVLGETGFLADRRDPQQFAAHLADLLTDPRLRIALGENAAVSAARAFAPKTVVPAVLAVYEAALGMASREAVG